VRHSHFVLGHKGQVGSALMAVLKDKFFPVGHDSADGPFDPEKLPEIGTLHVAIPWTYCFRMDVKPFAEKADLVVCHSTVPVGTCASMGMVMSPIRGIHPNLETGIRTFVKFFGGDRAEDAANPFRECGVECEVFGDSRSVEAMKLWSTTQYGFFIALQKTIHRFCEVHGLDPDIVYTRSGETYNEGYADLGRDNVIRPVLKNMPGPVGGHCVGANFDLLMKDYDGHVLAMNFIVAAQNILMNPGTAL